MGLWSKSKYKPTKTRSGTAGTVRGQQASQPGMLRRLWLRLTGR